MRRPFRIGVLIALAVGILAFPLSAAADHATRPHTPNMHALGHSEHLSPFLLLPDGVRHPSSDLAFWGNYVFQGDYDGFRIITDSPGDPTEISWTHCNGDQGDIVVWENLLVRSWNSKKTQARTCEDRVVPAGWEGVHVFDISNVEDPVLVGELRMPCGSHTLSVAGVSGNNLIVYSNNSSAAGCDGGPADGDFMDVIAVPLNNPSAPALIRREPLVGPTNPAVAPGSHDTGVIRGDVNMAVTASSDTTNVFSIGPPRGGSLEDPLFLYPILEPGVDGLQGRWHSGTFTWDGEVIILGWEPGGGSLPECEATDPPVKKSMFFYDADTGAKLGQWTLPNPQTSTENCTIHNYNIVPLRSGRYVATGGHYQAGTWVVDFTNPAAAETVGWSDPPPIVPPDLAGAWSSYWYNNFIYESEITKGLNVFRLSDPATAGAIRLGHLNPQTQEFSLD
jgi:hypothetical protein